MNYERNEKIEQKNDNKNLQVFRQREINFFSSESSLFVPLKRGPKKDIDKERFKQNESALIIGGSQFWKIIICRKTTGDQ